LSVRQQLTLSYAGFLMFAGALMLAAMWVFSYVPDTAIIAIGRFVPDVLRDPAPRAAAVLAFLLVFGLLGVGLGLAIVKSITQAHDGMLTLAPRPDGGLRVTVQLPAAPPHSGGWWRHGVRLDES
jgi:hypothetical protein